MNIAVFAEKEWKIKMQYFVENIGDNVDEKPVMWYSDCENKKEMI